jgi:hypothetical protein
MQPRLFRPIDVDPTLEVVKHQRNTRVVDTGEQPHVVYHQEGRPISRFVHVFLNGTGNFPSHGFSNILEASALAAVGGDDADAKEEFGDEHATTAAAKTTTTTAAAAVAAAANQEQQQ